jgi:hypothetical protein
MVVPDHAPPVAPRNHSLARTTVVNSSQTRTRGTMLALTSHYTATNMKHPRHAPCSWPRRSGRGRWLSRRHTGKPAPRARVPVTASPQDHHRSRQPLNRSHHSGSSRDDGTSMPLSRQRWNIDVAIVPDRDGSGGVGGGARGGRAGGRAGGEARAKARGGAKARAAAGGQARAVGRLGWGGVGMVAEVTNNHSCSDIGARNRTRFANVSLGTDDATRGRPPVPGAIR